MSSETVYPWVEIDPETELHPVYVHLRAYDPRHRTPVALSRTDTTHGADNRRRY